MKRLMLIAVGILCAAAITVGAAEGQKKKRELTDEQKKLMKEMVEKYDANKDGRLDQKERAKMSAEDKEKMAKAGLAGQRKGQQKKKE